MNESPWQAERPTLHDSPVEDVEGCFVCDVIHGRATVPDGLIHRTQYWHVDHRVDSLGIGTLIVKPSRHVVHVADMTDDEAAELGAVLRNAARVASALTHPEQVYVTLWSHAGGRPGHIHYVVQPITREAIERFGHGARLQVAMSDVNQTPDAEAVEQFATAARAKFLTATP